MDRIRAALGEEKVSYFGISYGTYLGVVYTSLFPERSDRFVLDSALSPGGWDLLFQRKIAHGVEQRFPDFAAWAAARPEYGLDLTASQVRQSYDRIAARLDETPLPGGYTGAAFRQLTFASLYYDYKFPALAAQWQALDQGAVPTAARSSQQSRKADSMENYLSSQHAVICNDSVWPREPSTYRRNVRIDKQRFPMFGGSTANISPCAFWPTQPQSKVKITDRGPANVLIAQNLRDPATPLAGARELRRAFGDRARMVTADQGGHLVYQRFLNQCLDDTVTRFLATGQLPQRDRRCAAAAASGKARVRQ